MDERCGLILAGAVAKGAFLAGALSVLSERRLRVRSLVGTSAGALNAAVYAAGVATGRTRYAARVIETLWRDKANWYDFISFTPQSLRFKGFSDTDRLQRTLQDAIGKVIHAGAAEPPNMTAEPEVQLRLVATDVLGHLKSDEGPGEPALTTFETVFEFAGADLMDGPSIERVAQAAVASASLPGLFAPALVDGRTYLDGGAVNNAPISYVIEAGNIDRVIVMCAQPAQLRPEPPCTGLELAWQVVDILINERLVRDLRQARRTNDRLARVQAALGDVTESQRAAVLDALGWKNLRIEEVRPDTELEGSAVSAFVHPQLRARYIEQGRACAEAQLP
jgi:NTE family protein